MASAVGGLASRHPHRAELWDAVVDTSRRAQQAGAIYGIETTPQAVLDTATGVEVCPPAPCVCGESCIATAALSVLCAQFVLRVATSLKDKPKRPPGGPPPVNPFLPYDQQLYVCHLVRLRYAKDL